MRLLDDPKLKKLMALRDGGPQAFVEVPKPPRRRRPPPWNPLKPPPEPVSKRQAKAKVARAVRRSHWRERMVLDAHGANVASARHIVAMGRLPVEADLDGLAPIWGDAEGDRAAVEDVLRRARQGVVYADKGWEMTDREQFESGDFLTQVALWPGELPKPTGGQIARFAGRVVVAKWEDDDDDGN